MKSTAVLTITGRVGAVPQCRETNDKTPITDVRVAVDEYKKGAGEHNSVTRWFDITLRGRSAEIACEQLNPGDLIQATGKLSVEEYEDRDGRPRFQLKVSAPSFDVLLRKQAASGAS